MNQRRSILTDRGPIIRRSGLKRLYLITIVYLMGSIAFACSESNEDPATGAGSAGDVNPVSNAGTEYTVLYGGTTGDVNPVSNAGTAGNVNPITDSGNATPATDAGNVTPTSDAGNASAACPDGNYWDITYDLPKSEQNPGLAPADPPSNQNVLLLRDTMMGIGDGNHNIAPGTATIRFENIDGKPGGKAYLLAFEIKIDFTAPPATTNLVGTMGHEYQGPCESAAVGNVEGDKLTWFDFTGVAHGTDAAPNVHSFFTDGTITCEGDLCGSFGAPPLGTTPNSGGPFDLRFEPWVLTAGASSFFAPPFITQKDLNSTTRIQVYGVEKSRECKTIQACD